MTDKTHCLNCGFALDRKSTHCPNCRVAQPTRPIGGLVGLVLLLGGLCVVTLVAILRA